MTGKDLKSRRLAANLLCRVVAKRAGVSPGTWSRMERLDEEEVTNAQVRLAFYEVQDLFAAHDVERDGPLPRPPDGKGASRATMGRRSAANGARKQASIEAAGGITYSQGEQIIHLLEKLNAHWGAN